MDREIHPEVEVCYSRYSNVWMGILYAFKGNNIFTGLHVTSDTSMICISLTVTDK